jgi:uncharacterized protein YjbI with pentapeptide repeats
MLTRKTETSSTGTQTSIGRVLPRIENNFTHTGRNPNTNFFRNPLVLVLVSTLAATVTVVSVGMLQHRNLLSITSQIQLMDDEIALISQPEKSQTLSRDLLQLRKEIGEVKRQLASVPSKEREKVENQLQRIDEKIALISQLKENQISPKDLLQLKKESIGLKKDQANAENALYSNAFQILGGMAFFATAFFSWRNTQLAQQNLQVTEEKQVTERLFKALDQLDSSNPTIRLGAIYALKRISQESAKNFQFIVEILSSFVQTPTENQGLNQSAPLKISRETQAALTIIGGFGSKKVQQKIDISHSMLVKASFRGLAFDDINLEHSNLREADLDGVDLSNGNLTDVNLSDAYIGSANLSGASLVRAKLDRINPIFEREVKQAMFARAILCDADIHNAQLARANFTGSDLSSAKLKETNLREADFTDAILTRADLSGADLSKANLTNTNLVNTVFKNTDIHQATFAGAKFSDVNLIKEARNWKDASYDIEIQRKLGLIN